MLLQNIQTELVESILTEDNHSDWVNPTRYLSIYRNNVIERLIKTLETIYPLIVKLVGNDFFHIVAKEYSSCYPSRCSNLNNYGEYFKDFLIEYPPLKSLVYIGEVAEFEWICHQLYFAADHFGFDAQFLTNLAPEQYEQLRFVVHPACVLKKFHYPILRIIKLCKNEIDETIDLAEGGNDLLIIRRSLEIQILALSPAEYACLHALNFNQSILEAKAAALALDPQFNLQTKLIEWISNKTLVECYLTKK